MNTKQNYLCLNGTKIPLTDEQVKELKESFGSSGVRPVLHFASSIFVSSEE